MFFRLIFLVVLILIHPIAACVWLINTNYCLCRIEPARHPYGVYFCTEFEIKRRRQPTTSSYFMFLLQAMGLIVWVLVFRVSNVVYCGNDPFFEKGFGASYKTTFNPNRARTPNKKYSHTNQSLLPKRTDASRRGPMTPKSNKGERRRRRGARAGEEEERNPEKHNISCKKKSATVWRNWQRGGPKTQRWWIETTHCLTFSQMTNPHPNPTV